MTQRSVEPLQEFLQCEHPMEVDPIHSACLVTISIQPLALLYLHHRVYHPHHKAVELQHPHLLVLVQDDFLHQRHSQGNITIMIMEALEAIVLPHDLVLQHELGNFKKTSIILHQIANCRFARATPNLLGRHPPDIRMIVVTRSHFYDL